MDNQENTHSTYEKTYLRNGSPAARHIGIRTDDGVSIHVRNWGIICDGKGEYYFVTAPKFEAPVGSRYEWLNDRIFVCKPDFSKQGYLSLNIWMVK